MRSILTVVLCALLLTAGTTVAQDNPIATGRKLFGEKKWKEAEAVFAKETERDGGNGQAWFWLGLTRYQADAYEEAISALLAAEKLGMFPTFTPYAVARVKARQGKQDEVFEWLNKAAAAGYSNLAQLDGEDAFSAMRSDPRMMTVKTSIGKNLTPTEFDERYRQLDFWIGEWDVVDANGTLQGTNSITKEIGGAVLMERWTNVFGAQGMSINFFDPGSGKFKQQWVAQGGYNTAYEGELVDGSMVMIGVNADIKGVVSKNRMTFTPNADGTVTQFIEAWSDSTQTWSPNFRGTYKRKQKE